ncbi:hypothetical protein P3X46_031661 [Hevea brasiliensis]|uniref:Retrotransposon gag domain-containing protein n=1 Tax=Hevea brasiliensis TaxID=3981 RepID=A0ABQ9KL14_HEVBR|nr:hypothetical protein P3X46_031661 [Hevea brasiliensis]
MNDYHLCQIFLTALIGLAQKWYQCLKPGSIQNFHQFATEFKNNFISSISPKKLSSDLQIIKQYEGESLRDYIAHFNTESIQVENLNHEIVNGRLRKFTRDGQDERRTPTPRNKEIIPDKDESPIGVINVIAEGLNTGKISNKQPAKPSGSRAILFVDINELSKETIIIGLRDNDVNQPHTDPLVVSVQINRYRVQPVLIDTSSSVNLLMKEVVEKLKHKVKNLTKIMYPLVGLGDKIVPILKTINLTVVLGDEGHKKEIYIEFAVINIPQSYNIILS